jgi:hypothetical protein
MTHNIIGCGMNVTESDLQNAFVIYPNPTQNNLTITVDGASLLQYRIFDIQGRLIQSEYLNNVIAKSINTHSLDKGTYVITVTTEHGDVSKKFIVE